MTRGRQPPKKKVTKLTHRQERFAYYLASGKTQKEAYELAGYKTDKMTDKTAYESASRVARNPLVMERYRDYLSEFSQLVYWDRHSAFNHYGWLMEQSKQSIKDYGMNHANVMGYLKAIEGMNKIAFQDLTLVDAKLKAEIKRIEAMTPEKHIDREQQLAEYMIELQKCFTERKEEEHDSIGS